MNVVLRTWLKYLTVVSGSYQRSQPREYELASAPPERTKSLRMRIQRRTPQDTIE